MRRFRHATSFLFVRCIDSTFNFRYPVRYFEISSLDRLLRLKPVIAKEDREAEDEEDDDYDGRPEEGEDDEFDLETDEGDIDPRGIVGKKLLKLGKIQYRHSSSLPHWFQGAVSLPLSAHSLPLFLASLFFLLPFSFFLSLSSPFSLNLDFIHIYIQRKRKSYVKRGVQLRSDVVSKIG